MSAPLSNYVDMQISRNTVGVKRAGFGKMLILSYVAAWTERYREYADLAEVAVDFPSTTGPEYLAAQAAFSQDPQPELVAIGRGALKPTMVHTLVPAVANSTTYALRIGGDGVTTKEVSVTSDASATATEICDALRTAINAVVGKNFTATGTTTVIITGDASGEWFWVEVANPTLWTSSALTHADPGVATDLAAILVENTSWYGLYTTANSQAYVDAAADWVESNARVYLADTNANLSVTAAVGGGGYDVLDHIHTSDYNRTSGWYHPDPSQMIGAALMGRCLPLDPGSYTFALKSLALVDTVDMTSTQRANIVAKDGNSYEEVAGLGTTFDGKTGDGEYLDTRIGLDWLEDDMAKEVFGIKLANNKVPYTNKGIAMIEGGMRASLTRATKRGILDEEVGFTITTPKVADVSDANITARLLPDMKFSGRIAGAVHKSQLRGSVTGA
jgi:hypothetical protein